MDTSLDTSSHSTRIIDCDARPNVPDGMLYDPKDQLRHVVCGQVEFDVEQIRLLFAKKEKGSIALHNFLVFGSQLLDFLLANQSLIPDSWKKNRHGEDLFIIFAGSIFYRIPGFNKLFISRNSGTDEYYRYMYWGGGRWCSGLISCRYGGYGTWDDQHCVITPK